MPKMPKRKSHWTRVYVEPKGGGYEVRQQTDCAPDTEDAAECFCQADVCQVGAAVAGQVFHQQSEATKAARRARWKAVGPCEVCGSFQHNEERHERA